MDTNNMLNIIKNYEEITGVTFEGNFSINGRLSKALGKCIAKAQTDKKGKIHITSIDIQISKKFLSVATEKEVKEVLAHEYAHYCTFKKFGNHTHSTQEFKNYCDLLDTDSSKGRSLTNAIERKYSVICDCCGQVIAVAHTANSKYVKYARAIVTRCCRSTAHVKTNW